jgi:hypothetical protein
VTNPPLILEFIGLPGCGKTTISSLVVDRLREQGFRCEDRDPLREAWLARPSGAARLDAYLANPQLSWALFRYTMSVGLPGRSRLNYIEHLLHIAAFLTQRRDIGNDIVVLDQSIVQTLWSLSIPGRPSSSFRMERVLGALLRPFAGSIVLASLEIPVEQAAERIAGRSHGASRFDGLGIHATITLLERYAPTLDQLATVAARISGSPHLRLDATRPLLENVATVADFAGGLLQIRRKETVPFSGSIRTPRDL